MSYMKERAIAEMNAEVERVLSSPMLDDEQRKRLIEEWGLAEKNGADQIVGYPIVKTELMPPLKEGDIQLVMRPSRLTEEQIRDFREQWERAYKRSRDANRTG